MIYIFSQEKEQHMVSELSGNFRVKLFGKKWKQPQKLISSIFGLK